MMTLLLLLSACGGDKGRGDDELALDIRTKYLGLTSCSATMNVKADYGERVYEYTMELSYEKEGETVLIVTAPENIAGITARIADGTAMMEFDGVSLETGPLDTDGLSPVGAVPALMDAVRGAYIAECCTEAMGETECLRVAYRDPEAKPGTGTELTVWFNTADASMVQGEISVDGRMTVQCVFSDFKMT
ncbi:MAG: hypothetical protein EOM52_03510 [Clostridia bacterium]|nr:hypothetical protein [Clostridia bacterium]